MWNLGRWLCFGLGLAVGIGGTAWHLASSRPALAMNDRHEDYIIATGPILKGPIINNPVGKQSEKAGAPSANFPYSTGSYDGIWLLDYRTGKLLGAVVDSNMGMVSPWENVDLVTEFNIAPKQNVHFLMTTGSTINGQTALYLTETTSGRFAIYSMSVPMTPMQAPVIRRHNASNFRRN
jgi:hypothetical protein